MGQAKSRIDPLLFGIIVAVVIVALGIMPISGNARSVATYVLIGIFSSGVIIRKTESKSRTIVANAVVWSGIAASIVITLL